MRVLLGPERHQKFREPDAEADGAVDTGMAGRAERDEPGRVMDPRAAVVDMHGLPCPADPAAPLIALQHRLPVSRKRRARMGRSPVADAAEPGDGGGSLPARAK